MDEGLTETRWMHLERKNMSALTGGLIAVVTWMHRLSMGKSYPTSKRAFGWRAGVSQPDKRRPNTLSSLGRLTQASTIALHGSHRSNKIPHLLPTIVRQPRHPAKALQNSPTPIPLPCTHLYTPPPFWVILRRRRQHCTGRTEA